MKDQLKLINEVSSTRRLIHLLERLIRFKTPAPPARNTEDAQQFIASFLEEKDFKWINGMCTPGDPNVVGV